MLNRGGKKIQFHHKRKHTYTSLLFSLHLKFGVVVGMPRDLQVLEVRRWRELVKDREK